MSDRCDQEVSHEALHRVGAGQPRVGCATADARRDPELRAVVEEWSRRLDRELPCGHTFIEKFIA